MNPISAQADGNESQICMLHWLWTCLTSHPRCGLNTSDNTIPKRLVDLGEGAAKIVKPCVIETGTGHSVYACLSYCWGDETKNRCRLLQSNITRFASGIDPAEIPKTVLDSFKIAKILGLRYIWVDALCIVQDDIGDWRHEAPRMGGIYRNAIVTIAAKSSEHADYGLLNTRQAEAYGLEFCSLAGLELPRPVPNIMRCLDDAPLVRRAWTTQEMYLSRRILHMTDAFVGWECRLFHGTENYPRGFPGIPNKVSIEHGVYPDYLTKELFRQPSWLAQDMFQSTTIPAPILFFSWQELVKHYSTKRLTRDEDILVAIGGLAASLRQSTGSQYLAGLWNDNIISDLLWQSDESRRRPTVYTAPSWSWASTVSPSASYDLDFGQESISFVKRVETAKQEISIENANVEYLDSNFQSQVISGELIVTGKISELQCLYDHTWGAHGGETLYAGATSFNAYGDPVFDTSDMVQMSRPLPIIIPFDTRYRQRATDSTLYCIALTREDIIPDWVPEAEAEENTGTYLRETAERMGYWKLTKSLAVRSIKDGRRISLNDIAHPFFEVYDSSPPGINGLRYALKRTTSEGRQARNKSQDASNNDATSQAEGSGDMLEGVGQIPDATILNLELQTQPQTEFRGDLQSESSDNASVKDIREQDTVVLEPVVPNDDGQLDAVKETSTVGIPDLSAKTDPEDLSKVPAIFPMGFWDRPPVRIDDDEYEAWRSRKTRRHPEEVFEGPIRDHVSIERPESPAEIHQYDSPPKRTASLDRDSFRRYTRRFKKEYCPPDSKFDRARKRQEALRTILQVLILELVEQPDQIAKTGPETYRRVGYATMEIRGGKTEGYENVRPKRIVII